MIEFIKAKRNYILMLAVFFVFISLSETTYSLFLHQDSTDEFSYTTGNVNLEFTEDEEIKLENTFPTIDSKGLTQKPYTLTIKNIGSLPQLFTLKMLSNNESDSISYNYIKVSINDYLPYTLASTNNIIANDVYLNPGESKTFNVKIWLDYSTPNSEIGKSFSAKIIATSVATYKTLDTSGANYPIKKADMIPVYYSEMDDSWHIANENNNDKDHLWYNYDNKLWANSLIVKNSEKYIYDLTRNNDLQITNIDVNNGNLIVDNKYLDIGLNSYNYNVISQIFRVKMSDAINDSVYIISNGKISYYYDYTSHKFAFKTGAYTAYSNNYEIEKDKWYILGYTYDGNNVTFYINGTNVGTSQVTGQINSGMSFKLGTDETNKKISNITFGDVLIYNRLLTTEEIASNYGMSMNIINDGLMTGYSNFTPMNLKEYYLNQEVGSKIKDTDVLAFYVWIPRYKYMVWNATGANTIDSYDASSRGINITFENGTAKSGLITCINDECFSDRKFTTTITETDNGKYFTHPAFTNGSTELTGFWMSKYEISKQDNDVYSIPGTNAWVGDSANNYEQAITKVASNSIVTTDEWAAVAYLSHSKYGRCIDNACTQIESKDTTTDNIYGVYDMANTKSEYTKYVNKHNLGNATKELNTSNGIWYGNTYTDINNSTWLIRGGNTSQNMVGLFAFSKENDDLSPYTTTRIVIK